MREFLKNMVFAKDIDVTDEEILIGVIMVCLVPIILLSCAVVALITFISKSV